MHVREQIKVLQKQLKANQGQETSIDLVISTQQTIAKLGSQGTSLHQEVLCSLLKS